MSLLTSSSNLIPRVIAALAIGAAYFGGTAGAGTVTTTMPATATVSGSCSNFSATAINFGDLSAHVGDGYLATATSTVSITCASGGAYTLDFNRGTSGKGICNVNNDYTWAIAKAGSPDYLFYFLSKSAANGSPMGATPACPGQTRTGFAGTGNNAAQTYTVYASLQSLPATISVGAYSDTVTLTATF